jgi:hypothetical protein
MHREWYATEAEADAQLRQLWAAGLRGWKEWQYTGWYIYWYVD